MIWKLLVSFRTSHFYQATSPAGMLNPATSVGVHYGLKSESAADHLQLEFHTPHISAVSSSQIHLRGQNKPFDHLSEH